jgi:hypothetical protein
MTMPEIEHATYALRDRVPMWVVYRPTTNDFPGQWVARLHVTLPQPQATHLHVTGPTLESVRAQLPGWLSLLPRQDGDDPVIEEVWL